MIANNCADLNAGKSSSKNSRPCTSTAAAMVCSRPRCHHSRPVTTATPSSCAMFCPERLSNLLTVFMCKGTAHHNTTNMHLETVECISRELEKEFNSQHMTREQSSADDRKDMILHLLVHKLGVLQGVQVLNLTLEEKSVCRFPCTPPGSYGGWMVSKPSNM